MRPRGIVNEYRARAFAPDLVIVSYFIDDVMRQFVYRGHHTFKSDAEMHAFVERSVDRALLKRLPWFGIYPELLAATLGEYLHLQRRLLPTTAVTSSRFDSQDDAIKASVASLERIRCLNPRMLVFHQPAIEELRVPDDDESRWPHMPDLIGLGTNLTVS